MADYWISLFLSQQSDNVEEFSFSEVLAAELYSYIG